MTARMPRRPSAQRATRPARLAASALALGGLAATAGLSAAVLATPGAAWAADCDRGWSISNVDGTALTGTALFSDERIAPGASLDGAFRVTTGHDIRGPLDVRAVRIEPESGPAAALEGDILVTLTGSSRSVTLPLTQLLATGTSARLVDELAPGAHDIAIAVDLPFGSANSTQLGVAPFQLEVTVSDEHSIVGSDPETCAAQPGGDGGAGGGSGLAGTGLASTGVEGGTGLTLASLLLGAGFAGLAAVWRRRRGERRHHEQRRRGAAQS